MCGRFTLTQSAQAIAETFELSEIPDFEPRYNIAPSQSVAAIVREKGTPKNQLKWMRWGLIPSWAKDPKIGNKMINARAETLTEKPSFRNAFKSRRCLVIADGFYEWKKEKDHKQPYYFQLENRQLFTFAGLWETWQKDTKEMISSCTIITTEANEFMNPIHSRMPVILNKDFYDQWLNLALKDSNTLLSLLKSDDSAIMTYIPVKDTVNKASHDSSDCLMVDVQAS